MSYGVSPQFWQFSWLPGINRCAILVTWTELGWLLGGGRNKAGPTPLPFRAPDRWHDNILICVKAASVKSKEPQDE